MPALTATPSTSAATKTTMRFCTILLSVYVFYSCQNSAGGYKPSVNQPDQIRPVDSFLKEGVFNILYYSSKQVSAEDKALLRKTAQLIKTNKNASRFFELLDKGETPVFTTNLGITKKEFQRLTNIFAFEKPKEAKGRFQVLQKGDVIGFKGEGALRLFDSVTIGPLLDRVYFKNYPLAYDSSDIDISAALIPSGDSLSEYRLFEGPDGLSSLLGFEGNYQLVIGKLQPSGRTFLFVNLKQPDIMEHPIPEFCSVVIERD